MIYFQQLFSTIMKILDYKQQILLIKLQLFLHVLLQLVKNKKFIGRKSVETRKYHKLYAFSIVSIILLLF